jgi:AraC-like DNA-binding protein
MAVDTERRELKVLEIQSSLSLVALEAGLLLGNGIEQHLKGLCDHFKLIFVLKGMSLIQEEGQAFEVKAGQALLLWPGWRYQSTGNHSPDRCFFWLDFRVIHRLPVERMLSEDQAIGVPQHTNVSRPDCLESLFRHYLDDQELGWLLPPLAGVLTWLMLYEVADARPGINSVRGTGDVAERALTYIHSHCHLPLTASSIANHLGYNGEYLNRVFHHTYQRTLTEEIHEARVARARRLLLDSSMSAAEIARASGFTDIKYFSRLFRKLEGMTPTAFRRLRMRGHDNVQGQDDSK